MVALSSSTISPAVEQLSGLPASDRALLAGRCPGLAEYLARVPDPRDPRGVRHTLTSLLLAAVAAVLAGARSFTAVGEWAADAPPKVLAALGVRRDPLAARFEPPDEATIRRILEAVDAAALDAAWVPGWSAGMVAGRWPGTRAWAVRCRRRAVAVDGKAVRGTRHDSSDGQAVHLLAALDQCAGAVLAQAGVDGKTNEITQFAPLAGAPGPGRVRHHRRCDAYPAGSRRVPGEEEPAGSVCPGQNLPWRNIPAGRTQHDRGHGREEHRILQVTAVAAGIAFPHAAQAIRVTRRIRPLSGQKKWRTVTVYAITSLDAAQAAPGQLAQWIRGHWQIEVLHHIRDVSYGEDASQIRTGSGPQAMAALRNLGIGILKMAGHASIAAACHHARDATRTLATLGLNPP